MISREPIGYGYVIEEGSVVVYHDADSDEDEDVSVLELRRGI